MNQSKEDETDEIEEDDSCSDKNADAACFEIMKTMANYKILFLSATPFKMFYTENEDTTQLKAREGLLKVIEILGGNKTEAENILNRNDKKELEKYLLHFMCRTERRETDLFTEDRKESLIPCVKEIEAFFKLNKQYDGFPVEYIKSTPFPLSFMRKNYEISKKILAKQNSITKYNCLTFTKVENYTLDVNQIHSRLKCLNKYAFGNDEKGKIPDVADYLLWLPPSYPAYVCNEGAGKYFSGAKDYSKLLVFSRWQMVPKMIAAMVSYQAEKIFQSKQGKYFSEHSEVIDEDHFFLDLTEELAEINIPFYQNIPLNNLRKLVRTKIKNMDLSLSIRGMKKEVELDILTDMAIGSPAVCLKRRGMDDEKIIDAFITYFNKRSSQQVLKKIYDGKAGYREVFKYCAEGNMQAVIDEYLSTLSNNLNNFCVGLEQDKNVAITWNKPKRGNWRKKMRSHFAMGFYTRGKRGKAKECERLTELRKAFNSPFRPFVLATTSCGQEGLDFHQYCRRIMHWNLPSNPIDFEQREGRINRYRNLAVRQSLCKDWKKGNPFEKGDVFKTDKKDNKGGLIPDWGLDENASVKIERILPFYVYSTEWNDYEDLKTALKYYRATIGMPKQTEQIKQMVESNTKPEDVALNLSPIHHPKQKKS